VRLIDADGLIKRLQEKAKSIEKHSTNEQQKLDTINGLIGAVHIVSEMPTIKISNDEEFDYLSKYLTPMDLTDPNRVIPTISVVVEFDSFENKPVYGIEPYDAEELLDRFCRDIVNAIIDNYAVIYSKITPEDLENLNIYAKYDVFRSVDFGIVKWFQLQIETDLHGHGCKEFDKVYPKCTFVIYHEGDSENYKSFTQRLDQYESVSEYILSILENL
jgi:hypothetical protein